MIVSGGENVYPAEIEAVLHDHAAVRKRRSSACRRALGRGVRRVRGAPRARRRDGGGAREHCRERLARFKVPKRFTFVEELPRTSMGKVLKDELRAGTG